MTTFDPDTESTEPPASPMAAMMAACPAESPTTAMGRSLRGKAAIAAGTIAASIVKLTAAAMGGGDTRVALDAIVRGAALRPAVKIPDKLKKSPNTTEDCKSQRSS